MGRSVLIALAALTLTACGEDKQKPLRIIYRGEYECFQMGQMIAKGEFVRYSRGYVWKYQNGAALYLPEGCIVRERSVDEPA